MIHHLSFTCSCTHGLQIKILCICKCFQQWYRNFGRNPANCDYFKADFCISAVLFSQSRVWKHLKLLNPWSTQDQVWMDLFDFTLTQPPYIDTPGKGGAPQEQCLVTFWDVFHLKYLWETPMLCGSFIEIKKGRSWRVLDWTLGQALSKILRVLQNLLPRVQGKRKMFVLSPGKSWGRLCVPMGRAGPALPDEEMKGEMPAKICTGVFGWCWASGPVFNTKIGWK